MSYMNPMPPKAELHRNATFHVASARLYAGKMPALRVNPLSPPHSHQRHDDLPVPT